MAKRVANSPNFGNSLNRWMTLGVLLLVFISIAAAWVYTQRSSKPMTLSIAAGPHGADSYELMLEVADVVSRHSDWLSLEIVPTRDSSQNISLLNTKQIDLATIRSDTPVASNIHLVANLFPDYFLLIARADRVIFKILDLVDKKVSIPRFGTDEFRSFWVVADHYNLPISAVKWHAQKFEKAKKALLDGETDALFSVRSLRDPRLTNLFQDAELKNVQLRFIPINQVNALALKRPFLNVGTVPKGAFLGNGPTPISDTKTATLDRFLVAREDIDDDAIRELTRILFEYRLDLTIRFALASAIREPETSGSLSIPLHEGAKQYYTRNEPSFVQENAEPLALLVTILAMLVSSMIALRTRMEATRKNRLDQYNHELLNIADSARKAENLDEILVLKSKMAEDLEKAVIALDTDDLTEQGFHSYSLLREAVRDVINDRLIELEKQGKE